ncbi:MAG: type II secretion system protein GspM [Methylococcaceae bacterium]|nr:type II secretion system protein GspM [Methylococcaceae bacterium]
MLNDVSPQRWLALGLFVTVMLLVVFIAIVPLVSTGMDYYEQKQELIFRLQRATKVVARKDAVVAENERIKQKYQGQNYFSTRDTVALASADLQKLIKTSISEAGGQLTSTQVLPSSSKDSFSRVTVKVRMTGDIEALRTVLHEIESSVPMMIVDQLDIRPVRGRRNRRTRKIEPSNKLNINFQVAGFMRAKVS